MASHEHIIALLLRTGLFGGLKPDALAACAALFRETRFAKGEMIFARGDPGTHLYLVAQGRVRLAIATDEGRELTFRHASEGDLLGEIAVLDGKPRTAEASALTPVVAHSLERGAFRELCAARAEIFEGVVAFLCQRLRDTSNQLESIALYPLEVRLARFLLFALGTREAAPGKRVPLELGFSQGELAQLLGASRPKVNAALAALENLGAVGRTLDRLFCDPTKLADIAQLDDG
jgi:CRP/FNR family cyclic AMP-dependent transcriptional regulator